MPKQKVQRRIARQFWRMHEHHDTTFDKIAEFFPEEANHTNKTFNLEDEHE